MSHRLHQKLESGAVRVIITSPEMVFHHPRFSQLICDQTWMKDIKALVIDEAHCVPTWGKEFRRDFGELNRTRAHLGRKPIFFCTATLTEDMQEEVLTKLGFERDRMFILNLGNERHNITQTVCRLKSPTDYAALDYVLREAKEGKELIPTIIYVNDRETAIRLWMHLLAQLPRDSPYRMQIDFIISTRDPIVKQLVLQLFMKGVIKILIGTEAIAMVSDAAMRLKRSTVEPLLTHTPPWTPKAMGYRGEGI